MEPVSRDDFSRVELRVGRIIEARVFSEARKPACVLQIDFGKEIGLRKSSAQIAALYQPEALSGKLGPNNAMSREPRGIALTGPSSRRRQFTEEADRTADVGVPRHRFPRRQWRRCIVRARHARAVGREARLTVRFSALQKFSPSKDCHASTAQDR